MPPRTRKPPADPWGFLQPAQHQTGTPPDKLLHSGNAGLIIHRVGQINHEFRAEAREFATALQQHNNAALHPYATALVYEEILGAGDRLHWLIHMRAPNDYAHLLEMVEHDTEFKEIAQGDRLTERGGGNWERMFVEGSFQEAVIVPQHGFTHSDEEEDLDGLFTPSADNQVPQPAAQQLHSGNARLIIHRRVQVRYAHRKQGRAFLFAWQDLLNRALPGQLTSYMYEETWGKQDRVHLLIHLSSLDDYRAVLRMEAQDGPLRDLMAKQWGHMVVDGSIHDTVLVPAQSR